MAIRRVILIIVVIVAGFVLTTNARRIRSRYYNLEKFPLIVYTSRGSHLIPLQYRREQLPFRGGIFDNLKGISLWIEQKRRNGLLSFRPSVVVLSPYIDFHIDVYSDDEYNWIRYLLNEELVSDVQVVFPSGIERNYPNWVNSHKELVKEANAYGYNLNLLTVLEDLPSGSKLGKVILVIDLAYFADKTLMKSADIEGITLKIARLGEILKHKNIRIEALLVVSSSQFVFQDSKQEKEIILDQLMELFSVE